LTDEQRDELIKKPKAALAVLYCFALRFHLKIPKLTDKLVETDPLYVINKVLPITLQLTILTRG
tara:strand:+ start:508 stop:699 length:192 start_codon:yes stop_codon:yes gene_type:complete